MKPFTQYSLKFLLKCDVLLSLLTESIFYCFRELAGTRKNNKFIAQFHQIFFLFFILNEEQSWKPGFESVEPSLHLPKAKCGDQNIRNCIGDHRMWGKTMSLAQTRCMILLALERRWRKEGDQEVQHEGEDAPRSQRRDPATSHVLLFG
jgi:hypothetical protein